VTARCSFAPIAGLAVAGLGLAHFAGPQLFESINRASVIRATPQHIYTPSEPCLARGGRGVALRCRHLEVIAGAHDGALTRTTSSVRSTSLRHSSVDSP
jgi:hypothetical protein